MTTRYFGPCAIIMSFLLLSSLALASGPANDPGPTFGPMDDYTTGVPIPAWTPTRSQAGENVNVELLTLCAGCSSQGMEFRADYPVTVQYGVAFTIPFDPQLPDVSEWTVTWKYGVNINNTGESTASFRIALNQSGVPEVIAVPGGETVSWESYAETDHYILHVNKHSHTYDLWGAYGVVMTVTRVDNPDSIPPGQGIDYQDRATLVANLPSPAPADLAALAPLVEGGGIRDMIAQSSRPNFEFGFAPYEAMEINARNHIRDACKRPEDAPGDRYDWGCNYLDCEEPNDYCQDDPKSEDFLVLPMEIPEVLDYTAKEFNALTMEAIVDIAITARRAQLENGMLVPKPILDAQQNRRYPYVEERLDFAIENDMFVYISSMLYNVPKWVRAAGWYGYFGVSPNEDGYSRSYIAGLLTSDLEQRIDDFLNYEYQGKKANITTFQIVNEAVRRENNGTGNVNDDAACDWWCTLNGTALQDNNGTHFTPQSLLKCNWHSLSPWYWLSDEDRNEQHPDGITAGALPVEDTLTAFKNFFVAASGKAPGARLMINEWGHERAYRFYDCLTGEPNQETFKSRAIKLILDELHAEDPGISINTIGFQSHFPAWELLEGSNASTVMINQEVLRSLRDAIRSYSGREVTISETGEQVVINYSAVLTELDIRIPVPRLGSNEWSFMLSAFGQVEQDPEGEGEQPIWPSFSQAKRQAIQGALYEAYLNAVLVNENLAGVYFWQLADQYSWLNRHRRTNDSWPPYSVGQNDYDETAQAALFGDNPCTPQREVWWPKPAYYGVRKAMENYFGPGAIVRDLEGNDVLRFVQNGNIVLIGKDAEVKENVDFNLNPIPLEDHELLSIRRMSDGEKLLVLHSKGGIGGSPVLSLAGTVQEDQEANQMLLSNELFQVHGSITCDVMCQLNNAGNLMMRGYFLVDGMQYQAEPLYSLP